MDIENGGMTIFGFSITYPFSAIPPSKKDLLHRNNKLFVRFNRLSDIEAVQGRGWELFSDDVIQSCRTSAPFIDIFSAPERT